jgi:hypothetical protein
MKVFRFRNAPIALAVLQVLVTLILVETGGAISEQRIIEPALNLPELFLIALGAIAAFQYLSRVIRSDLVWCYGLYLSISVVPLLCSTALGIFEPLRYLDLADIASVTVIRDVLVQFVLFGFCLSGGAFLFREHVSRGPKAFLPHGGFRKIERVMAGIGPMVVLPFLVWGYFSVLPLINFSFRGRFQELLTRVQLAPGQAPIDDYVLTLVHYLFYDALYVPLILLGIVYSKRYRFHFFVLQLAIVLFGVLNGIKGAVAYPILFMLVLGGSQYLSMKISLPKLLLGATIAGVAMGGGYMYASGVRKAIYGYDLSSPSSLYLTFAEIFYRQGELFEAPVTAIAGAVFDGRLSILRSMKAVIDGVITPGFDVFGQLPGSHIYTMVLSGVTRREDYIYASTPLGIIPEIVHSSAVLWPFFALAIGFVASWLLASVRRSKYRELFYLAMLSNIMYMGFLGGGLDELFYSSLFLVASFKIFSYFALSTRRVSSFTVGSKAFGLDAGSVSGPSVDGPPVLLVTSPHLLRTEE